MARRYRPNRDGGYTLSLIDGEGHGIDRSFLTNPDRIISDPGKIKMSEQTYSARIKNSLRISGWTVINMESLGNGIPDCLCAKNKHVFLLEFKYNKNKTNERQNIFYFNNVHNIEIFVLRKGEEGLVLFTDKNSHAFKSVKELVEFFERRIQ